MVTSTRHVIMLAHLKKKSMTQFIGKVWKVKFRIESFPYNFFLFSGNFLGFPPIYI